ncbi:MAG: hypothetical protein RJB66_2 [Pseudomonadota bacterium]
MPKYVSAKAGPRRSVIYTDSEGKQWQFAGGNRPWRNQNPGNLVPGKVSKRNGAIGRADKFAVFPNYDTGHAALLDSLKNEHAEKNIDSLLIVFAPPNENQTTKYAAFLRKKTGVKDNRKIKAFTAEEFEKLWQAIEQMEGWGKSEGTITAYSSKKQITGIAKDKKGVIHSYQIEGYGWVSKEEGIALALSGKVDAVVASSPQGNQFLRARPNKQLLDNLENKG